MFEGAAFKKVFSKGMIAAAVLTAGSLLFSGMPFWPEASDVKAADTAYTVTADVLNVRSGAGKHFSKIGSVKQGTKLQIIKEQENGWYQISFNGRTGYVSGEYVYSPAVTHEVNADRLNVRSGPGIRNGKIGMVERGTELTVIHTENNGWHKVAYNGETGFVSSKYVSTNGGQKDKRLDVPLIAQRPDLPSGCEATSLAMALHYYGKQVDKNTIAQELPYDTAELVRNPNGTIKMWGDPEVGFVGTPFGNGYTINPDPLKKVLDRYRPGGLALTGKDFSEIEQYVAEGKPVLVWFTIDYEQPDAREWKTPAGKKINAAKPLHNIVVTGVDANHVYFNDSEAVKKDIKMDKAKFINVYNAMGKRALVVN